MSQQINCYPFLHVIKENIGKRGIKVPNQLQNMVDNLSKNFKENV